MVEVNLNEGAFDFGPVASEHHHDQSVDDDAEDVNAQDNIAVVDGVRTLRDAHQLEQLNTELAADVGENQDVEQNNKGIGEPAHLGQLMDADNQQYGVESGLDAGHDSEDSLRLIPHHN